MKKYKANGKEIEVDNENKIFFPEIGLTKSEFVDYYKKISDTMLLHIKDRPLTMHRFPDGIEGVNFYQKQAPDYFPDWINRVEIEVKEEDKYQTQITCQDQATLLYLADQACITPHIWLSKKNNLYKPDKIVFDLDPPGNNFDLVKEAALCLKEKLSEYDLNAFVMTTGSEGMHVAVPVKPKNEFEKVREFAKKVSQELADQFPKKFTTEISKEKRRGKLFLDYMRNSYAQNSTVPYAIRAISNAPVATPLFWDEVSDVESSREYHIRNIFNRLGQIDDPWKEFYKNRSLLLES